MIHNQESNHKTNAQVNDGKTPGSSFADEREEADHCFC